MTITTSRTLTDAHRDLLAADEAGRLISTDCLTVAGCEQRRDHAMQKASAWTSIADAAMDDEPSLTQRLLVRAADQSAHAARNDAKDWQRFADERRRIEQDAAGRPA